MLNLGLKLNNFERGFIGKTKQDAEKGVNRGLVYMGAFIRRTAMNSIKKAEKHPKKVQATFTKSASGEIYAPPGHPPLSKLGFLKNFIRFEMDYVARVVTIGPRMLPNRMQAPGPLEHGGPTNTVVGKGPNKHVEKRHMQPRPFMAPALKKAIEPKNLAKFFAKLTTKETISISA